MQKVTLQNSIELVQADCLQYLKNIPDNSVDLICTDPPYFQVKSNGWDNQWPDVESFLAWLDDVLVEFWRVLKPSGSMYLFCGHALASDTEILIRDRFKVLNHIVWAKPSGRWKGANKESLRSYFPATERIIFAEHYGSDGFAKGQVGYGKRIAELKADVFEPLINYFVEARQSLGVTAKEINQATGTQMCSHWFSKSQWQLPNEQQYKKLQKLFAQKAKENGHQSNLNSDYSQLWESHSRLSKDFSTLSQEFKDLKKQYQNLRRPFAVTKHVPYTDVWTHPPVEYYPGKHPCEKPSEMIEHIIASSSREGDVILDAFAGSGSTLKAALKLGRKSIGIELEEDSFDKIVEDLSK